MKCVTERSGELLRTSFDKRQYHLLIKIRDIKGGMNARGVLNSSMCVNEVCKACVTEFQEIAQEIFSDIKRAHESCGKKLSKSVTVNLINLFEKYLADIKDKLSSIQEESVGRIARNMQNDKILQFEWLDNEEVRLQAKYRTEITMYINALRNSSGANLVERLKSSFFNNWIVAVGVLVITAVVALDRFTSAIQNLSNWASGWTSVFFK